MVEHARHAHALAQIHEPIFVLISVDKFFFVVALFQCVQIPVLFDVPKDGIHHDTGFVIRDVCNHCGIGYRVICIVQNIINVILSIRY